MQKFKEVVTLKYKLPDSKHAHGWVSEHEEPPPPAQVHLVLQILVEDVLHSYSSLFPCPCLL